MRTLAPSPKIFAAIEGAHHRSYTVATEADKNGGRKGISEEVEEECSGNSILITHD